MARTRCGLSSSIAILVAVLSIALSPRGALGGVPTLVDFENLDVGTAVFNQYFGVTFVGGDDSTHPITIIEPALCR